MEVAQSTFISSTFWTEDSSAAALKTLEVEKTQLRQIKDVGDGIRIRWDSLAKQYGLSVDTGVWHLLLDFQ